MLEFLRSKQLIVDQMLIRSTRRFPNKIALVNNQVSVTYKELSDRVNNLAGWLQTNGINKGDKVALLLYSGIEFAECLFALAKIGAIAVPVNFRLQQKEIEYILNNAEVKMLVVDHEFTSTIEQIRKALTFLNEIVVVNDQNPNDTSSYSYHHIHQNFYEYRLKELKDEDDYLIVYTSGTTGKPKGAVLTHKNIFLNAINYDLEFGITRDEIQLITTPMFHIGGISTLTMLIFIGGTSIIHNKFDPVNVLETFENTKSPMPLWSPPCGAYL